MARSGQGKRLNKGRLGAQFGTDAEMAVIERVASRPGQGSAQTFSLGHSMGAVQGALAALGVPTKLVAPKTMMSYMVPSRGWIRNC